MLWEMVRVEAYYSIAPHVKEGAIREWSDVMLPIDKRRKLESVSVASKLTKDELIEEYRKAGLILKDHVLDRIYEN